MKKILNSIICLISLLTVPAMANPDRYVVKSASNQAILFSMTADRETGILTLKVIYSARGAVMLTNNPAYNLYSYQDRVKVYVGLNGISLRQGTRDPYIDAELDGGTRGGNPTASVNLTNDRSSSFYNEKMPSTEAIQKGFTAHVEAAFQISHDEGRTWIWYSGYGSNFQFPFQIPAREQKLGQQESLLGFCQGIL